MGSCAIHPTVPCFIATLIPRHPPIPRISTEDHLPLFFTGQEVRAPPPVDQGVEDGQEVRPAQRRPQVRARPAQAQRLNRYHFSVRSNVRVRNVGETAGIGLSRGPGKDPSSENGGPVWGAGRPCLLVFSSLCVAGPGEGWWQGGLLGLACLASVHLLKGAWVWRLSDSLVGQFVACACGTGALCGRDFLCVAPRVGGTQGLTGGWYKGTGGPTPVCAETAVWGETEQGSGYRLPLPHESL